MEINSLLQKYYEKALIQVDSKNEITTNLDKTIVHSLNEVLHRSENAKAVITVIFTSCIYKLVYPNQDIRNHQTSIPDGYSGRTFDSKYITPFLKSVQFPAMAESGWLTRSLEQKVPYDFNYSGAIRPEVLKNAFLQTIDFIQKGEHLEDVLSFLFQGLIIQRNANKINLAKPHNLPITIIIELLTEHFNAKYITYGGARLPVLALYAVYQVLIQEVKRFDKATLLPLESHTSSDMRSGRIGDIDIVDENNKVFEAVEIKHKIPISVQLVKDAFEKFKTTQVKRYYLLSTVGINTEEIKLIAQEVEQIKNIHGCHVIVNGLLSSLQYYLRLLEDTSQFIENYVNLIEIDTALKFEHKKKWNTIVSLM